MTYLDERALSPIRRRLGEPETLWLEQAVLPEELEIVIGSGRSGRRHDVTFFVFNGERLALIRKSMFAPDVWRPPSGGVHPGEDLEAGVAREALEEIGVEIALDRYLLAAGGRFTCGDRAIEWRTHVFSATTEAERLEPIDTYEIEAARWGTLAELNGPIRARALATGRGLWAYRVAVHDATTAALGR